MKLPRSLMTRARRIRLLAMDVDGVLTDGCVVVLESGEEIKSWNVKDRLGLALMREKKIPLLFAWITGRESNAVNRAAKDLGIHHVAQRCDDKKEALRKILSGHQLTGTQAAFIGDDLIDLPVLRVVGLACSPANAVLEVKKRVHYVSPLKGGEGVARDVLELILTAQGLWAPLVRSSLS